MVLPLWVVLRLIYPMSECVATNCLQVKQKFSLASKLLLLIFRISYQGNGERMLLPWAVVKNWWSHLVSLAYTKNHTLQLWSWWHIHVPQFYYINYHRYSVDQVVLYLFLSLFFCVLFPFLEILIWVYNCSVWELSTLVFYKYWLK